jgi:four helix bundle protein
VSAPIRDVRDLIVWQRSMELAEAVYRCTRELPDSERFDLSRQLRRAAISVPSNIAEGYARRSPREYSRFLAVADGSVREIDTQLRLAVRLRLLTPEHAAAALRLSDEVGRMLTVLIRRLA